MFNLERYLALRSKDFRSKLEVMCTHVKLAGGEYGELIKKVNRYDYIIVTDYYLPVYDLGESDSQKSAPVEELHVWQEMERTHNGNQKAESN